ncbi:MAG: leucine--tRNA ligase [Gemmatimonadetes bacterium]|nr:leucine--tRNA ligase [Gemmatimonadota bacterium]
MATDPRQNPAYDPAAVEVKWQRLWEERRTNAVDLRAAAKPYFNLMMFPYPSAEGLHVGNVFAFVGSDIHGRFRRLQGWDVFEPLGFDAFGIHSENYALKVNQHPGRLIPQNIVNFRRQLKRVGLMIDWDHEVQTIDPQYYQWTQWIFVKLFEAGLAERRQAPVNWCPECKTVLANEQVVNGGYCERHPDTRVVQRFLAQWFFKITRYTERLLENLKTLDWSDSTRTMQANWIGRSEGAELVFETPVSEPIRVYTTRPDTIFGATYVVLAPEHPLVERLTATDRQTQVKAYRERVANMDLVARRVGSKDKTGVFTGAYARNPATGEAVPIWIADYVLMEYGSGAIMGVPAHDERDFEFARQFGLEIRQVVGPGAGGRGPGTGEAAAATPDPGPRTPDPVLPFTTWDGVLTNSAQFDGMPCRDAVRAITEWLSQRQLAKSQVQYRLHDWCISRQRYWGPPIPVIHCAACGPVPVPEKDLPVLLPPIEDFRPDESGVSPLARHEEWYRVPCPRCGKLGRRETDVSDTFLDSAWYFLRYPSTEFVDRAFDAELTRKWLPVSTYIGGNEHAVLHLMYSRFITMVLHDLKLLPFEEPYVRFRAHGTIVKDGAKMSKSRGNVVVPDDHIARWGADTFRMYLMFLGPYQEGGDFRDEGIAGIRRFLDKVWGAVRAAQAGDGGKPDRATLTKLHQAIRKVTEDIEELRYNTAIAAMMEYINALRDATGLATSEPGARVTPELIEPIIIMLAPLAPHFAEECWERLGRRGTVFDGSWPRWDAGLAQESQIELVVQVNGRVRGRLQVTRGMTQAQAVERALADDAVRKFVGGKKVRKAVYVEDRLVNLVV